MLEAIGFITLLYVFAAAFIGGVLFALARMGEDIFYDEEKERKSRRDKLRGD